MAFPTGYTKYQEVTIDYTKVAADLTDYVVYVKLADLVKAGADIFDLCRSDGGDIRATKADGTTELPIEVVAINTTAKTGELHIKYSGTLSSSSNTVIRIWYNGTDTALAATATYGRNNVWSDFCGVWHMEHSSGNATDSTSAGTTLTNTGVTYGTGEIGQGAVLSTSNGTSNTLLNTSVGAGGLNLVAGNPRTVSLKFKRTVASMPSFARTLDLRTDPRGVVMDYASGALSFSQGAGTPASYTWTPTQDQWYHIAWTVTSGNVAQIKVDGSNVGTSGTYSTSASGTFTQIGNANGGTSGGFTGGFSVDEVRFRNSELSGNWITTEYNNHDNPSTFYSAGNEQGGGTTVNASAQIVTATVPTYTVRRGARIAVSAQVVTASLPNRTIQIEAYVSANAQVATFTIPTYIIYANAIIFPAPTQVCTFSVPVRSILTGATIAAGVQTVTVSVPSRTVATGNRVSVSPVVLTLSIPTLAFIGALWRRSARTSASWTRSAVNND